MKLTILQENLKKGLSIISRITPKSLGLPILNNLLLNAEKNFLNIVATDLEIGIEFWTLAKIEKEGATTIPIKILNNFVNLLPNKPIEIESENNDFIMRCGSYKTKIKTLSVDDFPIIPKIQQEKPIFIDCKLLCQSLAQVVDIAQLSSARPEISGVFFVFQKDFLKMVATDSFRLGEKKLALTGLSQGYSFIVPQKSIREIINIFSEMEGELKICTSPNQVLFEAKMSETDHPQVQLISRLIEGEYPNYEAIIPKDYKTLISLDKEEFLNQIKVASLFSGKINEVRLKIDPKKEGVEIFSQNPDLGEYQSFISAKIKGEKADVSFNHRFLIDGLLNIKGNDLDFEVNGEEGPALLRSTSDKNYIYIVMPIKTD